MEEGKGVRKVRLTSPIKSDAVHTDDLAEREHVTSAVADKDHLVTPQLLMPETEDVVLAGNLEKDYLAQLAFNEELVEITIAEDSSEFPIDPVPLSVNGQQKHIKRGVPTVIPRKFVESLCSPTIRVATKNSKNQLGEDATTLEQTRSLQFPFSLVDKNPKGKEWLRQLLRRG